MDHTSRFDRVLSVVLTVSTVIAVGFLVEGRLRPPTPVSSKNRVELVEEWPSELSRSGVPLDSVTRPINIAVFTDFECPFCRRMDSSLTVLEKKFPEKITRYILHFPILSHANARAAALAFQCSVAQKRGGQMHHELYKSQSLLGQVQWAELAVAAGVTDTVGFNQCLQSEQAMEKIKAGEELARKLSVNSTPTVVVNGWLMDPSFPETIEAAVVALLAGKTPKH